MRVLFLGTMSSPSPPRHNSKSCGGGPAKRAFIAGTLPCLQAEPVKPEEPIPSPAMVITQTVLRSLLSGSVHLLNSVHDSDVSPAMVAAAESVAEIERELNAITDLKIRAQQIQIQSMQGQIVNLRSQLSHYDTCHRELRSTACSMDVNNSRLFSIEQQVKLCSEAMQEHRNRLVAVERSLGSFVFDSVDKLVDVQVGMRALEAPRQP